MAEWAILAPQESPRADQADSEILMIAHFFGAERGRGWIPRVGEKIEALNDQISRLHFGAEAEMGMKNGSRQAIAAIGADDERLKSAAALDLDVDVKIGRAKDVAALE